MVLDPEVKYPLLLSANFLITTNHPILLRTGSQVTVGHLPQPEVPSLLPKD